MTNQQSTIQEYISQISLLTAQIERLKAENREIKAELIHKIDSLHLYASADECRIDWLHDLSEQIHSEIKKGTYYRAENLMSLLIYLTEEFSNDASKEIARYEAELEKIQRTTH